jgi:hypothetical protein
LACSGWEHLEYLKRVWNTGSSLLSPCCAKLISLPTSLGPLHFLSSLVFVTAAAQLPRRYFAADAGYQPAAIEKVLVKVAP